MGNYPVKLLEPINPGIGAALSVAIMFQFPISAFRGGTMGSLTTGHSKEQRVEIKNEIKKQIFDKFDPISVSILASLFSNLINYA